MTWRDAPEILARLEKENLETLSMRFDLELSGIFHAFESLKISSMHDETSNQRIANFAEDFRWPSDTPLDLILECHHRIRQAQALAEFVLSAGVILSKSHKAHQTELPDGYLIRWLLTDYWHHAGVWRTVFELSQNR